jgi:hypothetical protein
MGEKPVIEQMIELFDEYSGYLGLADTNFPEMHPQGKQCEFEDRFNELVCKYRGHDIGPDQCGKPEHDFCYRCRQLASSLQGSSPPEATGT